MERSQKLPSSTQILVSLFAATFQIMLLASLALELRRRLVEEQALREFEQTGYVADLAKAKRDLDGALEHIHAKAEPAGADPVA
jgi:hypothetical protein